MKRSVIVLLIFIFVLFLTVVISMRKPSPAPVPAPTVTFVSPPPFLFPSPVSTAAVQYRVGSVGVFPQSLAVYSVVTKVNINLPTFVAKRLGFSGTPQVIQGTRGVFYVWDDEQKSLTYDEGRAVLVYARAPGSETSEQKGDPQALSLDFLNSLSLPGIPQNLIFLGSQQSPVVYQTTTLPSGTKPVLVYQHNYRYQLNGVPAYTAATISAPSVWARMTQNGTTVGFSVQLFPSFSPTGEYVRLVDSSEGVRRLEEAGGVLVGFGWSGTGSTPELLTQPPTDITISQAELAYYYIEGQQNPSPVYVFRGSGIVSGRTVQTITVVPAVP